MPQVQTETLYPVFVAHSPVDVGVIYYSFNWPEWGDGEVFVCETHVGGEHYYGSVGVGDLWAEFGNMPSQETLQHESLLDLIRKLKAAGLTGRLRKGRN